MKNPLIAICGHARQMKFLALLAEKGINSQAFLFAGPAMTGKRTIAIRFATRFFCENPPSATTEGFSCGQCFGCRRMLNAAHPDFFILSATENGTIGIHDAHEFIRRLGLFAYEGGWRGALIDGAENLSQDAQSALLKFLEEPPRHTLLFLITDHPELLFSTVRSRLFPVSFSKVGELDMRAWSKTGSGIKKDLDLDAMLDAADGRPGLFRRMLENSDLQKQELARAKEFRDLSKKGLVAQLAFSESIAGKDRSAGKQLFSFLMRQARDAMRSDPANASLAQEKISRLLDLSFWFESTTVNRRTLLDLAILRAYH